MLCQRQSPGNQHCSKGTRVFLTANKQQTFCLPPWCRDQGPWSRRWAKGGKENGNFTHIPMRLDAISRWPTSERHRHNEWLQTPSFWTIACL